MGVDTYVNTLRQIKRNLIFSPWTFHSSHCKKSSPYPSSFTFYPNAWRTPSNMFGHQTGRNWSATLFMYKSDYCSLESIRFIGYTLSESRWSPEMRPFLLLRSISPLEDVLFLVKWGFRREESFSCLVTNICEWLISWCEIHDTHLKSCCALNCGQFILDFKISPVIVSLLI